MRRHRLSKLWRRLHELRGQSLQRDAVVAEARRRQEGGGTGLAFGRYPPARGRTSGDPGDLHLRVAARPAAPRPAPRGPLPAALQSDRTRIRRRCGATTCGSQQIEQAFKEIKHDLAIRPIFHQREERIESHIFVAFIGLLPARDLEEPGPTVRAGADAAGHPGEVLHLADGGCPSADHGRASPHLAPAHATDTGPPAAARSTQAAIAGTTAAANLGVDRSPERQNTPRSAPCSADLWPPSTKNQSLTSVSALSCGSRARSASENTAFGDISLLLTHIAACRLLRKHGAGARSAKPDDSSYFFRLTKDAVRPFRHVQSPRRPDSTPAPPFVRTPGAPLPLSPHDHFLDVVRRVYQRELPGHLRQPPHAETPEPRVLDLPEHRFHNRLAAAVDRPALRSRHPLVHGPAQRLPAVARHRAPPLRIPARFRGAPTLE